MNLKQTFWNKTIDLAYGIDAFLTFDYPKTIKFLNRYKLNKFIFFLLGNINK